MGCDMVGLGVKIARERVQGSGIQDLKLTSVY